MKGHVETAPTKSDTPLMSTHVAYLLGAIAPLIGYGVFQLMWALEVQRFAIPVLVGVGRAAGPPLAAIYFVAAVGSAVNLFQNRGARRVCVRFAAGVFAVLLVLALATKVFVELDLGLSALGSSIYAAVFFTLLLVLWLAPWLFVWVEWRGARPLALLGAIAVTVGYGVLVSLLAGRLFAGLWAAAFGECVPALHLYSSPEGCSFG